MKKNNIMTYRPYGYKDSYSVVFLETFPPTNFESITIWEYKRVLIVFDTHLPSFIIKGVTKVFKKNNTEVNVMPFIYGRKSLQKIIPIWETMVDFVPDVIVGVGGGTISDLVGFAASTYQRGIPHILFPTTVLGMIDASLGGKTAIDFHGVKNCIGAVHYPLWVVNIMDALKTLPLDQFVSGLAEAVKAAILFDADFFHTLENYASKQDFLYNNRQLLKIMKYSASLKMLNSESPSHHKIKLLYGHAVGHALEILAQGKIKHGEGVSIGMTIEGAIAYLYKIWNKSEWEKQTQLLKKLHLPVSIPRKFNSQAILEKMVLYKKLVTRNTFALALPQKIGKVTTRRQNDFLTYFKRDEFLKLFNQALMFIRENA